MTNNYFVKPADVKPLATIRAAHHNTITASTDEAFNKLPGELDLKRVQYGADGSADGSLYEVTVPDLAVAPYEGFKVEFKAVFDNTSNANISVNGNTNEPLVDINGSAIVPGSIQVDQIIAVVRVSDVVGSGFQLVSTSALAQDVVDAKAAADAAEVSAAAALVSEGIATTKAGESAASAGTAATDAATATTKAGESVVSAAAALVSEGIATTKAGESAASAGTAATDAATATSAANAADTSFKDFDKRYLGPKTSDPTLDNEGNALGVGALYWNTTSNVMKVYNGTAWELATLSGALVASNNLSDVSDAATAVANLGLISAGYLKAGRKNFVINGDFRIWQRGVSFPTIGNGIYTTDRLVAIFSTGGTTPTVTQIAGQVHEFAVRMVAGSTSTNIALTQRIEDKFSMLNKTITMKMQVVVSATATNPKIRLFDGNAGSGTLAVKEFTPTGSLQTIELTATLSSHVDASSFWTVQLLADSMDNGELMEIHECQVEEGPVATDFEYRPIAEELGLCEWYGELIELDNGDYITTGQATSTSGVVGVIQLKAKKRAQPTEALFLSGNLSVVTAIGGAAGGTATITQSGTDVIRVSIAGAAGLVAGNAAGVAAVGATKIFVGAEL